jgi:hypothetical protein
MSALERISDSRQTARDVRSPAHAAPAARDRAVEVADQRLDAGIFPLLQEVPVERVIMAPFALLAELAAHEHRLCLLSASQTTRICLEPPLEIMLQCTICKVHKPIL